MSLDKLLESVKLDAGRKALVETAYVNALSAARVARDNTAKKTIIASRIIHITQAGERNVWRIVAFALKDLRAD
jgi:hypothetical protein